MENDDMITLTEAAKLLSMDARTIVRLAEQGVLTGLHRPFLKKRRWLLFRPSVLALKDQMAAGPTP